MYKQTIQAPAEKFNCLKAMFFIELINQVDPSMEMFKVVEDCLDKIEAQFNSK